MIDSFAAFLNIHPWPPVPDLLFWFALAIVGGALLGEVVYRLAGLTRTLGYGIAGIGAALLGLRAESAPLASHARLVVDLALALLLFELGSRVDLRWLRANPALLWTSLMESAAAFGVLLAGLLWMGLALPAALTGAAILSCASGALADRVAMELRPSGQVTDRMLLMSALSTVYCVLAVQLLAGWARLQLDQDWMQGVVMPIYTLAGSLLAAMVLHRLAQSVMRAFDLRDESTVLLLLGLLLLASTSVRMLGLSTILVPLLAGLLLRNTSARPCLWPRHFGTAGGVLVLMLFMAVGSSWSLDALQVAGLWGAGLMLARLLAKGAVLAAAARASGIVERQGLALALTLAPVSATALVLLGQVRVSHPDLARQIEPVVLSAVALMAVLGPISVQWGLRLARESRPSPWQGGRSA